MSNSSLCMCWSVRREKLPTQTDQKLTTGGNGWHEENQMYAYACFEVAPQEEALARLLRIDRTLEGCAEEVLAIVGAFS